MKYLLTLGLAVLLSNPFDASAQAMYSKDDLKRILETYQEVIVHKQGWEYKYTGNWLSTMELKGDYTLTFSRGRVVHSYDLSRTTFIQEEGNYVKFWLE